MATLKDVAKLANVDASTVSRTLNNNSYVHEDTRRRVMEAVEQLSYKPNLLAQGLRKGKRQSIGVIIPSISLSIFSDIVQVIEREATKLGYRIIICISDDDPEIEKEYIERLRNGLVDGIIIASTGKNNAALRNIQNSGIAVIQLIRKQDKTLSSIVANYRSSAYEAVKYLVSRGCKKIGLINGSMKVLPYIERCEGYKQAIQAFGLEAYVIDSKSKKESYFEDGYTGAKKLLEKDPDIDGIIVAADMHGIGVIRYLKEQKIAIPDQIKVMSLTGHSIGGMLETAMTSVELPSQQIGELITKSIVKDIEAPKNGKRIPVHQELGVTLVERETT
ncbi:LacI family DNA-binding transcriptional regulator [Trichococcus alkaliphilus]|uniref:LacI family DNA-binding transcriptional regulator n=1 Tax=Trichococcus alkaliphilus TaxID=2052943 RepID=UPI000D0BE9E5|nr:LacI family DNA-binding transcriptional regulator [Trichococcus alkaliphilus]